MGETGRKLGGNCGLRRFKTRFLSLSLNSEVPEALGEDLSGRLAALFKRLTQGVYIVGSLDRQPSGAKLVSSRLLQAAWPRLSWEAMPHSSLRCTLAVRCRSVEKSRGVRGQMPGHRQFANPPIEEAPLRPRQTSYGLGYDREPSRLKGSRGLMSSTSTSSKVQDNHRVGCRTQRKAR